MARMRRLIAVGLPIIGCLLVSSCKNPLLDTVRIMVEEAGDPLQVSFQPDPGTYTVRQSVQLLASKSSATIRYTTDGSEPTATNGTLYAGPVDVAASATIRARAFLDPYSDSKVAVGAFTIPFGGQLKRYATDPGADDQFGWAVAIDGDYAIVGAPFEDGTYSDQGAAYIFHRTGPDMWDNGVKIVSSNPGVDQRFGSSVDIDGDYAIVGNPEVMGRGKAYIFHRMGTNTWDSGCELLPPAVVVMGYFGDTVSISGDYAVVGASGENGGSTGILVRAGAAYVFYRTGTNEWANRFEINASNGMADDNFGRSVSVSSDYAIIGAPYRDGVGASPPADIGRAYIYHRTLTNTWVEDAQVDASVTQADANFGWSVDISGDYAIVGALNETESTLFGAGVAYIFHHQSVNLWTLSVGSRITATDPQEYDNFGRKVAISGDYAIGAAQLKEEGTSQQAGAVYSFHRTATNTWGGVDETEKWTAFDGGEYELFGCSVGMDGMYAIVGAYECEGPAPGNQTDAGAAYILH
jgi:hypothetical protein